MPRTCGVCAVTTIGIDMDKNTLHMVGLDSLGAIVLRERVSRGRITSRLANRSPCLIGIEAGMATHYVLGSLLALGHDVKQVPPACAKPFRQGHKITFEMLMLWSRPCYDRRRALFQPRSEQLDLQACTEYGRALLANGPQ
jgi:transposase